ncbi:RsmD family RNA methyltransferase [soil metagenome]
MAKPRIIGGTAKGRSLETPKRGTSPSPSRLREALFDILAFYERGTFLYLYSGSGAIGLEAASRGWTATCIDLNKAAANIIRQNAHALRLDAKIIQGDALKFAKTSPEKFDVVFAAPPYPLNLSEIFQTILDAEVAAKDGLYIFQHPTGLELNLARAGAALEPEVRAYGSNALSFVAPKTTT